jgi:hypothetical protein
MEPTHDRVTRWHGSFNPDEGDIPSVALAAGGILVLLLAVARRSTPVAPRPCARRGSLPHSPPAACTPAASSRHGRRGSTSPRATSAPNSTTSTPSRGRRCLPTSRDQASTARPRAVGPRHLLARGEAHCSGSGRPSVASDRGIFSRSVSAPELAAALRVLRPRIAATYQEHPSAHEALARRTRCPSRRRDL